MDHDRITLIKSPKRTVKADAESFLEFAKVNSYDPTILKFIEECPEIAMECPVNITEINNFLQILGRGNVMNELCLGILGPENGKKILEYINGH